MTGVIDPACLGSNQVDGQNLMDIYRRLGLELQPAKNSVESGLWDVWQLLVSGKLKIFKSCQNWLSEFRKYHRDEDGKIVKRDDHLMDATRYVIVNGMPLMKTAPAPETAYHHAPRPSGWMG
jgi:hypothetical protein